MSKKRFLAYLASITTLVLVSKVVGCVNKNDGSDLVVNVDYETGMTDGELSSFVDQMMLLDEKYYNESENVDYGNDFTSEEVDYIDNLCGYVNADSLEEQELYLNGLRNGINAQKLLQERFYKNVDYMTYGTVVGLEPRIDSFVNFYCENRTKEEANAFADEVNIEKYTVTNNYANGQCSTYFHDVTQTANIFATDEVYYQGIYGGSDFCHTTIENLNIESYNSDVIKVMAAIFGNVEDNNLRNVCSGLSIKSFDILRSEAGCKLEVVSQRGTTTEFFEDVSKFSKNNKRYDVNYENDKSAIIHSGEHIMNICRNMIDKALVVVKSNYTSMDSRIYLVGGVWNIYIGGEYFGMIDEEEAVKLLDSIGSLQQYLEDVEACRKDFSVSLLEEYVIGLSNQLEEYKELIGYVDLSDFETSLDKPYALTLRPTNQSNS